MNDKNSNTPFVDQLKKSGERLYYIDNLRIFFMLGVIVQHAIFVYLDPKFYNIFYLGSLFDMHSKFSSPLLVLKLFSQFISVSGFFLIAGYFAMRGLLKKGAYEYVKDRAKKLLIPFFIAFVIIIPLTHYISFFGMMDWSFTRNFSHEKIFSILAPGYGVRVIDPSFIDFFIANILSPPVYPVHLWFLPVLFFFSCVVAIFYVFIGNKLPETIRAFFAHMTYGKYVLLTILTGVITFICLLGRFPSTETTFLWFSIRIGVFPIYIACFLLGMLAFKYDYFSLLTKKITYILAGVGIILFILFLKVFIFTSSLPLTFWSNDWYRFFYAIFDVGITFSLIPSIVGLSKILGNRKSIFNHGTIVEGAMYIYLIHMPIAMFGQYIFSSFYWAAEIKAIIIFIATLGFSMLFFLFSQFFLKFLFFLRLNLLREKFEK